MRVVTPLLENLWPTGATWTIPRSRAEIEAREGVRISRSQLSRPCEKVPLGRTRHTLKGRQTEGEVEPVGLRLQLRKQQAEAATLFSLRR